MVYNGKNHEEVILYAYLTAYQEAQDNNLHNSYIFKRAEDILKVIYYPFC